MLYSYIVRKEIRKTFDCVNNHRWDEAVKALTPHVHHRVLGAHALGGERHDKEAVRRWFERLGRVLPTLRITVVHKQRPKLLPSKWLLVSKKLPPNKL
jgi:hypothetical protein